MAGKGDGDPPARTYVLAADGREDAERRRLNSLQRLFDPASRQRLGFVPPGARCLEIGAGRGSMALWLADRVGAGGTVVATDLDPAALRAEAGSRCTVLAHDIVRDPVERLGLGGFDLVYARFLLAHLCDHQESVVRRLASCLRPGGWLVLEDIDLTSFAAESPSHPLAAAFDRVTTLMREGFRERRLIDIRCGAMLAPLLARCGLVEIEDIVTARIEHGGGEIASWHLQSMDAISQRLARSHGTNAASDAATDGVRRALADPTFRFHDQTYHSVSGSKPLAGGPDVR